MPSGTEVVSLARQRKRHDDGRCHEPGCDGIYRVLCPYRGQHPVKCTHEHVRERTFRQWGLGPDTTVRRCLDCGQNIYPDVTMSSALDP